MKSNNRTSKVKNGILLAIVIAFLIAIIGGTYARFVSRGTVRSSTDIAKWHIVLGETQDISSESKSLSIPVQDAGTNGNVAEGKLAPGKTVVATFKVDPTGSEVAVDYSIGIDLSNIAEFSNSELKLTKVSYILEGSNTEEDMLVNAATGDFMFEESLNDVLAGKDVTFKIYVIWTSSTNLERSLADTQKAVNLENVLIPVNIVAQQHIGDNELVMPTLFSAKYTNSQIMDCQRYPANPSTGDMVTIHNFKTAYKYDSTNSGVPEGHYLKAIDMGKVSELDNSETLKSYLEASYGSNAAVIRMDEYDENDNYVGKYTEPGVLRELGEGRGIYLFISSFGYVICTTEEEAATLHTANTATLQASEILSTIE